MLHDVQGRGAKLLELQLVKLTSKDGNKREMLGSKLQPPKIDRLTGPPGY